MFDSLKTLDYKLRLRFVKDNPKKDVSLLPEHHFLLHVEVDG